jgi:thiosulfate dehydrogenase (quinone) large subunit
VIVGDMGVFSARSLIFGPPSAQDARSKSVDLDRRRLVLQLGALAVAAVWVLGVVPRQRQTATAVQPSGTPAASSSPVASPTGTKIGSLSDLQTQGFLNFQDPKSGDPAVAVALAGGTAVAFDAVCTHAGCQVAYDTGQKLLACPCHGALFDPAHGAAVVAGPASTPLGAIPIQVGADGGVYAD